MIRRILLEIINQHVLSCCWCSTLPCALRRILKTNKTSSASVQYLNSRSIPQARTQQHHCWRGEGKRQSQRNMAAITVTSLSIVLFVKRLAISLFSYAPLKGWRPNKNDRHLQRAQRDLTDTWYEVDTKSTETYRGVRKNPTGFNHCSL